MYSKSKTQIVLTYSLDPIYILGPSLSWKCIYKTSLDKREIYLKKKKMSLGSFFLYVFLSFFFFLSFHFFLSFFLKYEKDTRIESVGALFA